MASIFITGSNDGLGRDAARRLADDANAHGTFDAVIQNAGVGYREPRRIETEDGHARLLAINVLAPYRLTAWMHRPRRIVVLTSGMQQGGSTDLSDLDWTRRRWNGTQAHSDSKLFDATFAAALARRWPQVVSVSVSPGWVATKMGGAGAPDDLDAASATQAWIAGSDDDAAVVSGAMYYHRKPVTSSEGGARSLHPAVTSEAFQDDLLAALAELTGFELPAESPAP